MTRIYTRNKLLHSTHIYSLPALSILFLSVCTSSYQICSFFDTYRRIEECLFCCTMPDNLDSLSLSLEHLFIAKYAHTHTHTYAHSSVSLLLLEWTECQTTCSLWYTHLQAMFFSLLLPAFSNLSIIYLFNLNMIISSSMLRLSLPLIQLLFSLSV